jgi:hypothetical protein
MITADILRVACNPLLWRAWIQSLDPRHIFFAVRPTRSFVLIRSAITPELTGEQSISKDKRMADCESG